MAEHPDKVWQQFCETAFQAMTKFHRNEINMSEAYRMLDRFEYKDSVEKEVHDFVEDMISEIDGFPTGFEKLKLLFGRNASLAEVRDFIFR